MIDLEELKEDKIQTFVKDRSIPKITKEGRLEDKQYCTCGCEFSILPRTGQLLCHNCGYSKAYDENVPLTKLSQDLSPHLTQLEEEYNPNDEDMKPFFWSLIEDDDPNNKEPDFEVTHSSADGRVQHIKLKKGVSPTEYRMFG